MASPLWVPGFSPYAEYLKRLTPEEKAVHLAQRKAKKSMKRAWDQVVAANQEIWISRINEAMVAVLNKAVQNGDPAALTSVANYIIGKPTETIQTEDNQILPWSESVKPGPDETK